MHATYQTSPSYATPTPMPLCSPRLEIQTIKVSPGRTSSDPRAQEILAIEKRLRTRHYRAMLYYHANDKRDQWAGILDNICNDHELHQDYWISVVFEHNQGKRKPLISCRYFTESQAIQNELAGEAGAFYHDPQGRSMNNAVSLTSLIPATQKAGTVMLDRLCNEKIRDTSLKFNALGLILRDAFDRTGADKFICLARMEKHEPFLMSYAPFGLRIVGQTQFRIGGATKTMKFWILEVKKTDAQAYAHVMSNVFSNLLRDFEMRN